MKGDASCHIPNDSYRDNYDSVFKKKKKKKKKELDHEWVTNHGVIVCQYCGVSKSPKVSSCNSKIKITNYDGELKVTDRTENSNEK